MSFYVLTPSFPPRPSSYPPDLAPSAQRQVNAYRAGRNGLANNGPDDGPAPLKEKPVPKKTFAGHMAAALAELRAGRAMVDKSARTGRRSEEHTSELQSLMRISYAVFCLKTTTKSSH